MESLVQLVKMIVVLLAGVAVGNWFYRKVKEKKARSAPWYEAYLTVPGLIVLAALIGLPLAWWWLG